MYASLKERLESKLQDSVGTFVLLVFFVVLSFIHMSGYFEGRFWGEEGAIFYRDIGGGMGLKGLLYIYNGHIEIVTNFIVYVATLFSFKNAPAITTYLSYIFQSIPVVVVISFRKSLGITFFGMLFFLVVLVGLPHVPEVWANSINLHFHFAFLAALILAIPVDDFYPKRTFRGLLLLSGLSGIPANFLAPLYIVVAAIERKRERVIQAAIISMTAFFELAVLFFYGRDAIESRLGFDFMVYWLSVLSQQIVNPIGSLYLGTPGSGFYISEWFQVIFLRALAGSFNAILFSVLLTAPLIYFLLFGIASKLRAVWVLIASMLILSVACFVTSLGDKAELISFRNPRYFYVPTVLMVLFSLIAFGRSKDFLIKTYFFALLFFSVISIRSYHDGRPWLEALSEAQKSNSSFVEIWPRGEFMSMPKESRSE